MSLQRKIKIKLAHQRKAGESIEDDVVNTKDPTQANASVHKQDKSTWFNTVVVERAESPDLEYMSDQLDWVNPKGYRIPHDLSKPIPLYGALGHLTILVYFFYNKYLAYLTTKNVGEKKYATSLIKPKAARYELEGIEEMIPRLWISSNVAYDKMLLLE
ncbi:hypothetical protein Tco_0077528 [Tanacetum coccineum]